MSNEVMTVQQLIDALQAIPDKNLKVLSDGCDCHGEACSIKLIETREFPEGLAVLVARAQDEFDDHD